tara:strand:+ start:90 stop:392 length:303 start_codon:yes stop_codon:yes gene_type:complete
MINKSLKKILKELKILEKDSKIKFAFSYIEMGKDLNDLNADVIHNMKDDIASATLMTVIETKLFETSFDDEPIKDQIDNAEGMAKLEMFNLFNRGKKYNA